MSRVKATLSECDGLLQTDAYARAVFHSRVPVLDEDDVEQHVAARTERREIFHREGPWPSGESDSFKTPGRGAAYGDRMTPRFDAIGLVASDMAASIAFYRRLGFAFSEGAEKEPHAEAGLPGGLRLMLDSEEMVRSFDPEWQPAAGDGRIAIALLCQSPAEVDSVYQDMVGAGHQGPRKPWDAVWGQRYASLLDPDGNGVDLFAPLPGAGQ